MGFGKAFGICIALFIGINFGFVILASVLSGTIGSFFLSLTNMSVLIYALFGPIVSDPGYIWLGLVESFLTGFNLTSILLYVGYIVAPLLAALIGGYFGGSKGASFGAWFLTACISFGVIIVITILFSFYTIDLLIIFIMYGVINGFFYGCFALLAQSGEF